jgi:exosortase J
MSASETAGAERIPTRTALPAAKVSRTQLLLALVVTLLGLAAFSDRLIELAGLWTTDGLRSIGILVLPVSAWLAFRSWRWSDWQSGGSWWGAIPIAIALLAAGLDSKAFPTLHLEHGAVVTFTPIAVRLLLYVAGAVIFFGGLVPLRRALFPLALILLINPCPHFVEPLLDLPLQNAGARIARGFAGLIGVPLDGDLLHLMFTPSHGVFIAPGCDGLRGSITLGFATLVAGHLYRLRPWVHVGYVLAAILTAYLLNFLRLCIVVIYSALAAHVSPTWFGHGESFDYFEGGILFLLAAAAFLNWPRRHPELCTPK